MRGRVGAKIYQERASDKRKYIKHEERLPLDLGWANAMQLILMQRGADHTNLSIGIKYSS